MRLLAVRHSSFRIQVHATVLAATPNTSLPLRLLARIQRRKAVWGRRPGWPILTAFARYSSERQHWQTASTPHVNIVRQSGSKIVGLPARSLVTAYRLASCEQCVSKLMSEIKVPKTHHTRSFSAHSDPRPSELGRACPQQAT